MQRKLLVSALLLLLAFVGARAQTDEQKLCAVVQETNGTKTEFLLGENPCITYGEGVVNVSTSATKLELKASQVMRVYMKKLDATPQQDELQGISTAKTTQQTARVAITPAAVTVTGLEPGSDAALYASDGRQLKAAKAAADGTLSLPMPTKSQGVLIVKTKNQSFKIINKQ